MIYKEVFIENWNRLSIASHYRQQVLSACWVPAKCPLVNLFDKKLYKYVFNQFLCEIKIFL